ncbi:hypothetical protein GCM10027051_32290 [Niabella terrae]
MLLLSILLLFIACSKENSYQTDNATLTISSSIPYCACCSQYMVAIDGTGTTYQTHKIPDDFIVPDYKSQADTALRVRLQWSADEKNQCPNFINIHQLVLLP